MRNQAFIFNLFPRAGRAALLDDVELERIHVIHTLPLPQKAKPTSRRAVSSRTLQVTENWSIPGALKAGVIDHAVIGQDFAVGRAGLEGRFKVAGNFSSFDPAGQAHGVAQIFVRLANQLPPPHESTRRRAVWVVVEADRGVAVVFVDEIVGLGIAECILIPNVPVSVVGDGRIGRSEVKLKIIGPELARAVKIRPDIKEARFIGNVGDEFDLPPVHVPAGWAGPHRSSMDIPSIVCFGI